MVANLSLLRDYRGISAVIQCHKGTEFTSVAIDHWCNLNQVRADSSRLGKTPDNVASESFHNSFRRDCRTQHSFIDITGARGHIEQYRSEYSNDRLHSSLRTCHRPIFGHRGDYLRRLQHRTK